MNRKSLVVSLAILVIVITIISLMAVTKAQGDKVTGIITSVIISVVGIATLVGMNKTNADGFDERMLKARGDAALNALVVTLITGLCIGLLSMSTEGALPLTLLDASMISSMTGAGTFIILADMQDAYLGMKEKRKVSAICFGAVGVFIVVIVLSRLSRDPGVDNAVPLLTLGIVWIAVATEMVIKMACDKRAEKMETADEES